MCGLDRTTSLTVFFDISPSDCSSQPGYPNPNLYIQFVTNYQDPEGQMRMRVTTITQKWVDGTGGTEELVEGFDQETAAVVLARYISLKMEMEEEFDATRWLDRSLIRLCSRFGDYRKDDSSSSFTLHPNLSLLPQFMFNLRRSQFVQAIENGWLPGDILDDIPCKYLNGTIICEVSLSPSSSAHVDVEILGIVTEALRVLVVAVLGILPIIPRHLSNKAYRLSLLGTTCCSFYSLYTLNGVKANQGLGICLLSKHGFKI